MHGLPSSDWTPDRIQRLRALWHEGHSVAQIGRRLGISKNAVVGKAHRLNLPGRPNPIHGYSRPHPDRPRRARAGRMPAPPVRPPPPPSPRPVVFSPPSDASPVRPMGPVSECCWPIGEPGRSAFRFCGAPSEPRKPYCTEHSRLAYVRPPTKEVHHG